MVSDLVRQASKVLGPLLRRRGTSPALGAALRRALQALDKSLSGLSPQAQDETVEAGIAELRACVEIIGKSDRPADHDQLEGINRVLGLLAPAEVPAAVPPPPPVLDPGSPAQRAAAPVARERKARARRTVPPAFDFQTVGTLLLGLEAKLGALHVVLSEPLFTLADRYAAGAELERQVQALQWLGRARVPDILRVADLAQGLEDRLVAGAALVYLGEGSGAEMLIGILGKAAVAKQAFPETSPTLLGTLTDAVVLDWLLKVFLQPAHPAVCALLLPLLVEQKRLAAEALWPLVNHAKDDVAVAAASALPWVEGNHDVEALLGWARAARTPQRAHALLFAAAALGSAAALAEARTRLRQDGPSARLLVDALAVAGGPADARLLAAMAENAEEEAGALLLAAGHLGCSDTLRILPSFAERVPARLLEEVQRLITGSSAPGNGLAFQPDPTVRSLRGQPWSVEGVLARLGSPDETLQAQRHMTLELRARTGQAPPSPLPTLLPGAARGERLASWTAHFAKASGKLRPGGWYLQSKACPSA